LPEGILRFRMLETVREYAIARLSARGRSQVEAVEMRHTAYFLAFAEQAEPELVGARMSVWRVRLEREYDNIRAALQRAIERRDTETAYRFVAALAPFWAWSAHMPEARQWFERVLALDYANPDSLVRARVIALAATFAVA